MSAGQALAPSDPAADSGRENFIILFIAAGVLLLTNLPYLYGLAITPDGMIFTGHLKANSDVFTYWAKMRQGAEGHWMLINRFTSEPHAPALIYLFYLLLGHLAHGLGLSIVVVWHGARIGSGLALMWSVDRLLRTMQLRGAARVLAFTFAFTAGGIGWLLWLLPREWTAWLLPNEVAQPFEFWVYEAFAFQSMANLPHFALSSALIVWILTDFFRFGMGRAGPAILARIGLMAMALAWVHPRMPLTILAIGGATALWGAWRGQWSLKPWVMSLGVALVCCAVPVALMARSLSGDPVWNQWTEHKTLSPMPQVYLAAFGLLWPLAILGAWRAVRAGHDWAVLLVAWFAVGALLPYLPMDSQRRFIHGYGLPLSILAGYGVGGVIPLRWSRGAKFSAWRSILAGSALALVLSLSTLFYVGIEIQKIGLKKYSWFHAKERSEAMRWLERATPRDAVVMCSLLSGLMVPGFAGNTVVIGHWAETIGLKKKMQDVQEFFQAETPDAERDAILDRYRVRYLLFSAKERKLGPYDPAQDPDRWRPKWQSNAIAIYERISK